MFVSVSTSSGFASVSLFSADGELIRSDLGNKKHSQSETVASMLNDLLTGVERRSLLGFFVDVGPGSFTGIRVGVSLAVGFCAFGTRISGISSLMAINYKTQAKCVFVKSVYDEYYYQIFGKDGEPRSDVAIATQEQARALCLEHNGTENVMDLVLPDSELIGLAGIREAGRGMFYEPDPIYVKSASVQKKPKT